MGSPPDRQSSPASAAPLFGRRSLKICYWNAEARVLDAERMTFEKHLARLGDVKVTPVTSLEDAKGKADLAGADLLIVAAQMVPDDKFADWLSGFRKRIQGLGMVWTPALILADVPFDVLSEIWPEVTKENWYFDILAPSHVASVPIRVANLLRIHDHLHEMKRYAAALDDINTKVRGLEAQVAGFQTKGKAP